MKNEKDYIDLYREAVGRDFSEPNDSAVRENFYNSTRSEVEKSVKRGWLKFQGYDDYLENRDRLKDDRITVNKADCDMMAKSPHVPVKIFASYFGYSASHIRCLINGTKTPDSTNQ